ncbi:hypothetical protein Tco_1490069 [Tanacetum coccineum]
MFTTDWSISSLPNFIDSNFDIYVPPVEDPLVVRNSIFYERPPRKTRKIKKKIVVLDPFQMLSSEVKLDFKKWETILSENVISLSGNKDHLNACLSYMIYCLSIQKPFNLAYYIAQRIESVTKSDVMELSYGMLLTRLYGHFRTSHPYFISDIRHLVDHVMLPLTEGRALRIRPDRKRPHPQTPLKLFGEPSPTPHQEEEDDLVNNYTLDPIADIDQIPPIKGGESPEFKQTKGMFKCFGHFLSNLGKKK